MQVAQKAYGVFHALAWVLLNLHPIRADGRNILVGLEEEGRWVRIRLGHTRICRRCKRIRPPEIMEAESGGWSCSICVEGIPEGICAARAFLQDLRMSLPDPQRFAALVRIALELRERYGDRPPEKERRARLVAAGFDPDDPKIHPALSGLLRLPWPSEAARIMEEAFGTDFEPISRTYEHMFHSALTNLSALSDSLVTIRYMGHPVGARAEEIQPEVQIRIGEAWLCRRCRLPYPLPRAVACPLCATQEPPRPVWEMSPEELGQWIVMTWEAWSRMFEGGEEE